MSSLVVSTTTGLVAMLLLVRVVLDQLVHHVQRMRMTVNRMMTMLRSDHGI